jgi:hypothetical protein
VTDSHGESLIAVNARVPPPVFVTLTETAAGFVALPREVPNLRAVCETASVGDATPPPPPHAANVMQATAKKIRPTQLVVIPSPRSLRAARLRRTRFRFATKTLGLF